MRKSFLIIPGVLLVAACTSTADVPPIVTWSYGAGNGDGVQYSGPAPKYSFANGLGKDVPVSSGGQPTVSYGYGAESTKGDMIQMTPQDRQQVAAPATAPVAPGTHS